MKISVRSYDNIYLYSDSLNAIREAFVDDNFADWIIYDEEETNYRELSDSACCWEDVYDEFESKAPFYIAYCDKDDMYFPLSKLVWMYYGLDSEFVKAMEADCRLVRG